MSMMESVFSAGCLLCFACMVCSCADAPEQSITSNVEEAALPTGWSLTVNGYDAAFELQFFHVDSTGVYLRVGMDKQSFIDASEERAEVTLRDAEGNFVKLAFEFRSAKEKSVKVSSNFFAPQSLKLLGASRPERPDLINPYLNVFLSRDGESYAYRFVRIVWSEPLQQVVDCGRISYFHQGWIDVHRITSWGEARIHFIEKNSPAQNQASAQEPPRVDDRGNAITSRSR